MKKVLLILLLSIPLLLSAQRRKFTPIFGTDTDVNKTLAFVTENLVFDSLTYTRLQDVKGYARCSFVVDTKGRIKDVQIKKSIKYWLDYEIIKAMQALPAMDPFQNKKGEIVEVKREVYFTFNNSGKNNDYYKRDGYDGNILQDPSLERQRQAQIEQNAENRQKWDKFTADNSKLSLDGKSIHKPGVLPSNPLKINTPPIKPPITITINAD